MLNAVVTTECVESLANKSEISTRKIAALSNPADPELGYMYP